MKEGKEKKDEMVVAEVVPKSVPPPKLVAEVKSVEVPVGTTAEVKKKIETEEVLEMPPKEEAETVVKEKMTTKKAAKKEKAVKRLGAHVDRLLGEILHYTV